MSPIVSFVTLNIFGRSHNNVLRYSDSYQLAPDGPRSLPPVSTGLDHQQIKIAIRTQLFPCR
jgi:hypothetical protein